MGGIQQPAGGASKRPRKTAATDSPPPSEPRRIGDELKDVRLGAGKALKDIAGELRIRADHLRAIEESDYQRLPGPAYVAGFVRSYANYLGFDGAEIAAQVREETQTRDLKQPLVFPEPVYEARMPAAPVVLASALAAVVILVIWIALSGDERQASVTVPEVPERLTSRALEAGESAVLTNAETGAVYEVASMEAATPAVPTFNQMVPAVDAGGVPRLTIRASDDAWLSIRKPQGEPLFEGILRAGESIEIPGGNDLTITTGNAGYLEIAVNGEPVEALGPVGAVIRDLSLAPDDLRLAAEAARR